MASVAPGNVPPLAKRLARYERIMAMRRLNPPMTFEAIGLTFTPALTKERVRQIAEGGRPRANGRPGRPDRAEILREKLNWWQQRLANARREPGEAERARKMAAAQSRIEELTAELGRLG